MDVIRTGYGLAAASYALVALISFFGLRQGVSAERPVQRALVAALLASAAWCIFMATVDPKIHGGRSLFSALADVARYAVWFVFLGTALSVQKMSGRRWRQLAGLSMGVTLVAATFPLGVALDYFPARSFAAPRLFASLALPVVGLVLLEQLFRNVHEDFRWHVKPLCLALLSLFTFDLYVQSNAILFAVPDDDSLAVRPMVQVMACVLFLVASRRRADWIGRLQVSHSAALHTATLVLVGVYLVFVSVIGYYVRHFGGDAGRALQIGLLALALVALAVVLASASVRAKLRVMVGKNFFSYRYDYRTEWLRFTATLTGTGPSRDVGELVIRGVADLLHVKSGALWTLTSDGGEYAQTASWNAPASTAREPRDSAFARYMLDREWIIDLDECRSSTEGHDRAKLPEWLNATPNLWLVVPLIESERLVGFVVLAPSVGAARLDWEARDLLKTAARQAAGFLAQAQATEALLEARKFDSFNRMSAFVVHDLKNIVTQLSLMMQNARRLQDNPEFRQDMLATVDHSLEKMRQLMLQLRDGAVPAGTTLGVDLAQTLRGAAKLADDRGRVCELEIVECLAARGHDDRIARVIGHVVQNAFDATPATGRVWARLDRAGGRARVVVGDTGCGMTQDFVRNRLFKPFSTTKEAGMGIGAYESFQYIRELGGSIEVDSEIGRGTVVTLLLPLFDVMPRQKLHEEAVR